ncbi:hypothetical protein WJX81_005012 [Elliptochloris bilobata]|uniref:FCP1 homology domain-containing protein n=1 Tax=Elliptochloris bilobata TaxID=381761 RepID=A0AAW1QY59_9CHLO
MTRAAAYPREPMHPGAPAEAARKAGAKPATAAQPGLVSQAGLVLITSSTRKRRRGAAEAPQAKRPATQAAAAHVCTGECAAWPAGGRAKGVLGNLLSPVFTLFNGGSWDGDGGAPMAERAGELAGGQRASGGCSENARAEAAREGADAGAAAPTAAACSGASVSSAGNESESDTCVDERALCTLVSRATENGAEYEAVATFEAYDEECLEFDPYAFIKSLPPLSDCVPPSRPAPLLPRQTRRCKRKTLVLDLDETLVHSTLDTCESPDFAFSVAFNGRQHTVNVKRRPHLAAFLEAAAALFEVVVFTASQKVYAEQLINVLDPGRRLIRHRVFRDSCVLVDGNYLKDLSVLGRDLACTAIIDNSPQAFGFQLANGIPIESWYDDERDAELLRLLPFLERLSAAECTDVRPLIANTFKLHQLVARAPSFPAL